MIPSLSITNLMLTMSGLNPNPRSEKPTRHTIGNSNSTKLEVYVVHLTHYVIIFESQYTTAEYQRHKNTRRDASRNNHFLWKEHCIKSCYHKGRSFKEGRLYLFSTHTHTHTHTHSHSANIRRGSTKI